MIYYSANVKYNDSRFPKTKAGHMWKLLSRKTKNMQASTIATAADIGGGVNK